MGHISLLLTVAVILLGAKVVEVLSRRVGVPPVLGEVLYGVIIGPGLLNWVHPDETISLLGSLGVVLLLFIAGLETRVSELRAVGTAAMLTATGGVAVPFALGVLVGRLFSLDLLPSLFLGTILTATSVSISAETLRSMGRLKTRAGTTIMGAAIVDDVMGLMVLAAVAALGEGGSLLLPILRVVVFALVAVLVGLWLLPRLIHIADTHLSRDALLALVLAFVLAYAWAAAQLGGLADITGAYLAGLLIGRTRFQEHAAQGSLTLGYGLLIPIFLVWVGMQANLAALTVAPLLALAVTIAAIAGKLLGCYAGARSQLRHEDSLWVAVAMISRGEVALVVATAGRNSGLVSESVFAACIAMTLATTVLAPIGLRLLMRRSHGTPPPSDLASATAEEALNAAGLPALAEARQ